MTEKEISMSRNQEKQEQSVADAAYVLRIHDDEVAAVTDDIVTTTDGQHYRLTGSTPGDYVWLKTNQPNVAQLLKGSSSPVRTEPAEAELPANLRNRGDAGDQPAVEEFHASDVDLDGMTLAELRDYAAANDIDLGDAKKKAAVVEAITASFGNDE